MSEETLTSEKRSKLELVLRGASMFASSIFSGAGN